MKFSNNQFDRALDHSKSTDKIEDLKDFYGVETADEVHRIQAVFRDKVEAKKLNVDMGAVKYRKTGINEYKAKHYINDAVKVPIMGTEKSGKELIIGEISSEIQAPAFLEDSFGNIWAKI